MKAKAKLITREMAIRRLRELQGSRTLRAFAAELGISYQYLSEIMCGRRNLGPLVLQHLGLEKRPRPEPTYVEVER